MDAQHWATLIGSIVATIGVAVPATILAIAKLREVTAPEVKAEAVAAEAEGAVTAAARVESQLQATIDGQKAYIAFLERRLSGKEST